MYEIILNDKHEYFVDGVRKPGFSEIMASVGVKDKNGNWRSLTGSEFIVGGEVSSVFGKAAHGYIAYDRNGVECYYDASMLPWLSQYHLFVNNLGLSNKLINGKPLIEKSLYSRKYGYCGTIDLLASVMFGKRQVAACVDWKTATAYCWYWDLQLAAYCQLVQENYPEVGPLYSLSARIHEKGVEPKWRSPLEVKADFNRFLSVFNTLKIFNQK